MPTNLTGPQLLAALRNMQRYFDEEVGKIADDGTVYDAYPAANYGALYRIHQDMDAVREELYDLRATQSARAESDIVSGD